jgi:pSer/pThr/pTyr-binding forkhead associated (FHA) protein
MPYISFKDKDDEIKYYPLPENKMVVFGREEHTDFQILEDGLVSREHFGIEKDDKGNFMLIDLGASNGTFLNERQVGSNELRILKNADKIRAGRQEFVFLSEKPVMQKKDTNPLNQVMSDIKKGKGYHTIMAEIIEKHKHKKPDVK